MANEVLDVLTAHYATPGAVNPELRGLVAATARDTVTQAAQAQIPGLVAQAIADDDTVAQAAAEALSGVMASQHAAFVLPETTVGVVPDPLTGWTVYGSPAPAFNAPAKQGTGAARAVAGRAMLGRAWAGGGTTQTVEFWANVPAATTTTRLLVTLSAGQDLWVGVQATSGLVMCAGRDGTVGQRTGTTVLADGAWHHVAVILGPTTTVAPSRVERVFVDGRLDIDFSDLAHSTTATDAFDSIGVGGWPIAPTSLTWLEGWAIDSLRVSSGARYTAPFTPPTIMPADASTLLWCPFDPASPGHPGYDPRPAGATDGAVTYIGSTGPTDWRTGDRWYQV